MDFLFQAARAVLQNPEQVNQMLNDLNKVDFANLQEQVRNLKYAFWIFFWTKRILMFETLEKIHLYFNIISPRKIINCLPHFWKHFFTYYYIGTLHSPFYFK